MKKTILLIYILLTTSVVSAKDHVVKMGSMKFYPAILTVKMGDKVTWINQDIGIHAAASKIFNSGSVRPKKMWSYKAVETGEFPYKCLFHSGMKGTLIVKP